MQRMQVDEKQAQFRCRPGKIKSSVATPGISLGSVMDRG